MTTQFDLSQFCAHPDPSKPSGMCDGAKAAHGRGDTYDHPFVEPDLDDDAAASVEELLKVIQDAERGALKGAPDIEKDAVPDTTAGILEKGDGSLSDAKMSERVAEHALSDKYVWCSAFDWMRWDGKRWKRTPLKKVREVVRRYLIAFAAHGSANAEDAQKRAYLSLLSKKRISDITELASGILAVECEVFDAHPDLLNTQTGVVDLRTGDLLDHDPQLYMTHITAVGYKPGASHPDWDKALMAVPEGCRKWFQVRSGQGVTGHMTSDDTVLFMRGGGENGKSTVQNGIMSALGEGYQTIVSERALIASADAHPTELMDFRGCRYALAEELPEGKHLNVKRLKDIAGTPRMKARYMRQDTVTWDATHSFFLSTNYLPIVAETDHGTWRRLLLLEFPYKFVKPGVTPSGPNELPGDTGLRVRMTLVPQLEAVLAWLVEGAKEWYAAGMAFPVEPKEVTDATHAWRAESDLILRYWSERIAFTPDMHVVSTDLYDDFDRWLRSIGKTGWSDQLFHARFQDHDVVKKHGIAKGRRNRPSGDGVQYISRPPIGSDDPFMKPIPSKYVAYAGIAFQGVD